MVRIAGSEEYILKLDIDIVLIICSLLLEENFFDFRNFFNAWVPYQTPQQISYLLHNLDWTNMHLHTKDWYLRPLPEFDNFLGMCKDRRIKHALCYEASKNLINGNMAEENLDILHGITEEHPASFVTFHVFRPICRLDTVEDSGTSLLIRLDTSKFRREFQGCVQMLRNRRLDQDRGWYFEDRPGLYPPALLLCSFGESSSTLHFNINGGFPTYEKVLSITCSKCLIQMLWYIIFED